MTLSSFFCVSFGIAPMNRWRNRDGKGKASERSSGSRQVCVRLPLGVTQLHGHAFDLRENAGSIGVYRHSRNHCECSGFRIPTRPLKSSE